MVELNENKRQNQLISRINELAHRQKTVGLDEAEKLEQQTLRQEYLANFRQGFKQQLLHTKLYNRQGREITPAKVRKIQKKNGWRPD
ncbi:DUF896 domain-containing protein [Bombilactobacillus bombi]|uniref:DUF896 domain-containing protein n=1 Tax=Bombilactobacillus bombi TaxID=1303590 RepID=UPI0015E5B561|nr:DUF896 domain-containing protein [Bombilactobacillus bombi]MBA1434728.1 DUF896 domain-containing protein [Bombilactobacillus bombi]